MSKTYQQLVDENIGVKTNCKTQYIEKLNWQRNFNENEINVLKMWKSMYQNDIDIISYTKTYVKNRPISTMIRINSERVGVKSTISTYTNKKGIKSLVHFTANGKYIGSVSTLGVKPIYYDGYFNLKQYIDILEFDIKKLSETSDDDIKCLEQFFY